MGVWHLAGILAGVDETLGEIAESVDYVALKGAGHFMFRRVGLWNSLATGFILDAFAASSGGNVRGSADAFRSLVPASGASLPVVL